MFKKCRSELEFLLSIVDGCPDPERDVANAISELDLAERRLQAAEKLAEAGLVIVNEVQGELNLSKLIRASNKTIEGFPAIARLQKALAAYRAATKEGK